jgi:ribosomal protein S18 acetylase RimI-like enzyme
MGPNADRLRRPPSGLGDGARPQRGDDPGPSSPLTVRRGTPGDASAVAALHAGGITEGFLSLLGNGFLRRLYRRICLYPGAFLLVAELEGRTAGFIAGATDVPGLYRSFLGRDGLAAALSALGPLLRGWRRVLETLRHGSPSAGGAGGAELLSVAVDPQCQGRGAARRLVASFLEELVARGCMAAHVVVGADNQRAIALYESAGFVTTERFELHPGTESLLMRWEASGVAPSPGAETR